MAKCYSRECYYKSPHHKGTVRLTYYGEYVGTVCATQAKKLLDVKGYRVEKKARRK